MVFVNDSDWLSLAAPVPKTIAAEEWNTAFRWRNYEINR
jgi:hypothetical protein